jgi:hypothetical protein
MIPEKQLFCVLHEILVGPNRSPVPLIPYIFA